MAGMSAAKKVLNASDQEQEVGVKWKPMAGDGRANEHNYFAALNVLDTTHGAPPGPEFIQSSTGSRRLCPEGPLIHEILSNYAPQAARLAAPEIIAGDRPLIISAVPNPALVAKMMCVRQTCQHWWPTGRAHKSPPEQATTPLQVAKRRLLALFRRRSSPHDEISGGKWRYIPAASNDTVAPARFPTIQR